MPRFFASLMLALIVCAAAARAQTPGTPSSPSDLRMVVIVTRHGVRSPTDPNELAQYAVRAWPAWEVPPGNLTPNGATSMRNIGASYRSLYVESGLLPAGGCPAPDSVYVWADVDQRTEATADALIDGLVPHCGFARHDLGASVDPLFHALPSVGTADAVVSSAAVASAIGTDPLSIVRAYGLEFSKLDAILGCTHGTCRQVSKLPLSMKVSPKTGLADLQGAVDVASTAVEDFILAYADGKPAAQIGWGAVDRTTLLELSQLHSLKYTLNTELPYVSRVQGSNLFAHVVATLDQGATATLNQKTRAPLGTRLAVFVGHDTNLEELAGMLGLRWLLPGYQLNDTPPGGALVFEVHQSGVATEPFVRTFFTAQSLEEMRTLSKDPPERATVFVPGCPALDCPLSTFDRVANAAIDPAFVAPW